MKESTRKRHSGILRFLRRKRCFMVKVIKNIRFDTKRRMHILSALQNIMV